MLDRYSVSDDKKIKTLLEELQLGDQKPSALLNEMRALAGIKIPDDFLKQIWLGRLPSQVRMIVSISSNEQLPNLAKMADRLMELSDNSINNVASRETPSTSSSSSSSVPHYVSALEAKIDELTKRLDEVQFRGRDRSKSRKISFNRDRAQTPPKTKENICWWHYRFGDQAKRCKSPCKYAKN